MTIMAADPLRLLPAEVVLHIIEWLPLSALASLTSTSKAWNCFIEDTHQDAIYASKTEHPKQCRDFSFLNHTKSYANYFAGVHTWKELCKRQTLLQRNWNSHEPVTRESFIQVGEVPVWRFRPDFESRFIVSTSQAGGLNVTGELAFSEGE